MSVYRKTRLDQKNYGKVINTVKKYHNKEGKSRFKEKTVVFDGVKTVGR